MSIVRTTVIVFFTVVALVALLWALPFLFAAFGSALYQGIELALVVIVVAFVIAVISVTNQRTQRKADHATALKETEPFEEEARANDFVSHRDYCCAGALMPEPQRSEMAKVLGFSGWEDYAADYKRRTAAGEWLPGLRPAVRFSYPQYPDKRKDYVWNPDDFPSQSRVKQKSRIILPGTPEWRA